MTADQTWTDPLTPTPWADRYLLAVKTRLDAGVRDIAQVEAPGGDPRTPQTIGREILTELLDVSAWAAVLWHRMKDLEELVSSVDELPVLRARVAQLQDEITELSVELARLRN